MTTDLIDVAPARRKFAAPGVAELSAYAESIGFRAFDAQAFLDYYEMIGWVCGKSRTPMRSWRAAVRVWQRNQQAWTGAPRQETDPVILDYAAEARRRIAAGGYDIGRFWAKVRDVVGDDGLNRVRALAKTQGTRK